MAHPFIAKLSPTLFWDVEIEELDPEKHRKFIVQRVLERGADSDWYLLKEFYSLTRIVETARVLRYLSHKSLAFISCVGNVPKEEFRCYIWRQSNPLQSPF